MTRWVAACVVTGLSAQNTPPPREFTSVFTAHGQVMLDGSGPAIRARVVGCGAEGWTDSKGKFAISGISRAGGYLDCTINVMLEGFEPRGVQLTAPGGSVNVGTIVLKPVVAAPKGGMVSAASLAAPPESQKLKAKARQQAQKGNWRGAQRELEAALKQYRFDPEAWVGLGIAHRQQGDTVSARDAFKRAIEIDPKFPPPLVEIALLAVQDKEWPTVIDLCTRAVKMSPDAPPEAHIYLGIAYLNTGDFAGAESAARSAIAASGDKTPKAHHVLGVALAKQGRAAEGIEELRTFLKQAPNAPEAATVQQNIRMLETQK